MKTTDGDGHVVTVRTSPAAARRFARQRTTHPGDPLPSLSRWVLVVGAITTGVLVLTSSRYSYHRDELYFLEAGRHLAWGYPDLPPLVPLTARILSAIAPGSLVLLRLPSAVAAGAVVLVTGLLVRELDGGHSAQLLAAVTIAASGLLLGVGHYLNTSAFDLFGWTLLLWLFVRLLRTEQEVLWLPIGVMVGIGLLNSDLVFALIASILFAVGLLGPRRLLWSRWAVLAGLVAALAWTPYLVWQARHGWPQLIVSRSIAAGNSGTSTPRALLVPSQFFLISPYLAPIWIVGLVRLFRDPCVRWCRAMGLAYVILAAVFVVTGGKSYYLAGMLPVLVAAGAQPAIDWLHRGRPPVRMGLLAVALCLTIPPVILFTLPVLPVSALHRTPIVTVNYDEGETVGWPTYVAQIAGVYRQVPADQRGSTAILTSNYGEAGAVDRFGSAFGLPAALVWRTVSGTGDHLQTMTTRSWWSASRRAPCTNSLRPVGLLPI